MALELKNVVKRVGAIEHIKGTSLILESGHFNVLLGATGSGKTSLIKLMAGLDPIASGSVWMEGRDVTRLNTQKRNISLVHQFFINYPHMTVFENIASPLKVAGMAKSEIEGRVEDAADILQLRPMLHRRPHELSGGQQQRCALARAIAKESQAVFLDEPLANLDYKLREELRDQLPELFAGRGAVVVYATSEPEEALLLGGKTALMRDGRVTQFGPTAEIYRDPQNVAAARVFSDPPINTAEITKQGNMARLTPDVTWVLEGAAADLADGTYTVAIRPYHVLPVATTQATVRIAGRVQVTELSGSESSAHFDLGLGSTQGSWVSLSAGVHPYQVGEMHDFYMDPSACYFFAPDGSRVA
ncbi:MULTISPECIES: ABC transporter ATP-binding protein [Rhodobacterales]|jgi:glycerol transport system ATP-binding protein|uniref:ABC transporter ATP-binding protein n=1 Tax=Rhodobacterales TaxID=204455 RepID=UPI00237FD2CE|nr:ABC transporter ATP-binding protein [Phaeobacter gallaeciensis]MDE4140006.1 ABC transporter ATP-binding protein [Phaeobacter gallaeciensis]MDE4148384.1 ABC transporter ATP-binding protein [Phaeobacter gallaeciensis]MDE4152672.1 ABC transporter ATP-binding protein [Phaeobacter gallaeciensis]MDE4227994.1 ABC transporter ATP-binding protein [Phaeobacter gallaeciensis]MDE4257137.1 ABC transporter ATP-binding protein [Phaeobacter gallaeciensis]